MNCKPAGWYLVYFKNGTPIADKVTQETIDFLIKNNPNFINWFYFDKPFYLYGNNLETLRIITPKERSFKGVF